MKLLLFPFALLYGIIVSFRNMLYDNFLKPYKSSLLTIGVGNLQVGGSGKTPMTALLFDILKDREKIAILSRGYGRSTRGLIVADENSTASTIGDEPLWYYKNLKDAMVVVAESRKEGLKFLEKTDRTLVLLDDAFQHRAVKLDLNFVLSEYRKPYFKDSMMPMGRLREPRSGAKRADVLVITKCPVNLDMAERDVIKQKSHEFQKELVWFSTLKYDKPYVLNGQLELVPGRFKHVIALSGLAYSGDFNKECARYGEVIPMEFKDHHKYSRAELEKINSKLDDDTVIICTEKDAIKLKNEDLKDCLIHDKYFALPVQPEFLNGLDIKINVLEMIRVVRKSRR